MKKNDILQFQERSDSLQIEWGDGHTSTFHYVWLKDNAPEYRHESGQRLVDTVTIALDSRPTAIELNGTLNITWNDAQVSQYDPVWLRSYAYEPAEVEGRRRRPTLWAATDIDLSQLHFSYPEMLEDDQVLRAMLTAVKDLGFAIWTDVPVEEGMVLKAAELFGFVRETNYGSLFDVKVTPNPTNLAFTSLTLPGHTDNPYRHPVPTLQLLHYLINDVDGGDNTLTDGFKVAESLRQTDPAAFELLASTPVTFRYRDSEADLEHESTIIQTDVRGRVIGVRVNSRSIQPFYAQPDQMTAFYKAYQTFGKLLADERFQITLKLNSGDLMLFDNQRVLHGRVGYNSAGGERHLQGCYADKDSLYSKLAVLNRNL